MVSVKLTSALAAFLLATPLMVAATPLPRALPDGAVRLAVDEDSKKLIAYDASGNQVGEVQPTPARRALPDGAARLAIDDDTKKLIAYDSDGKEIGKVQPTDAAPKKRANRAWFPRIPRDLPAGAVRLAADETTKKLIAYDADGKEVGQVDPAPDSAPKRRDTGSCSNLSADDVQKLPGWKTLNDQANTNWGDGKRNIVTNDKDFTDQPAQSCTDNDSMTLEKNEDASCTDSKQTSEGSLAGSNGTVALTFTKGTSYTSKNTVTKESSIATGVTVSAKFSIPEVFEMGGEVSTTTTFTNSLSNEQSATASNTQTSVINQQAPEGKKCKLEFNNKECTIEGKGKVRFTATGWVWFQYEDKTHDHYKWALNIDEILKNVDDRSSFAEFKAAVSSTTTSDYKGVCE